MGSKIEIGVGGGCLLCMEKDYELTVTHGHLELSVYAVMYQDTTCKRFNYRCIGHVKKEKRGFARSGWQPVALMEYRQKVELEGGWSRMVDAATDMFEKLENSGFIR